MNIDDKRSEDERILDKLVERYIAEEEDGLTHEEREKTKRGNRINAIKQWCVDNPNRDPTRAKDKTIKQLALDEEAVVRREEFRKNNPEKVAEIRKRTRNERRYRDNRATYKERLPRDYLHKDRYETRLKKAEALNGCRFKTRTFKSKRFTDEYAAELKSPNRGSTLEGHWVESDGKQLAISWFGGWSNLFTALSFLLMVAAVMFFFVDLVVIGFVWGDYRWVPFAIYAPMFIVGFYMLKHRAILAHRDNFYFNRHTGLVKTPHTLFRKPFYLPYEDIVCYGANERNVGSARGGSRVFVSLMVPLKYPKHYRFTKPTFYVGGSNREWDSLAYATAMTFMDTSIPLGTHLYQSIEHYFKIDKDITEKHTFPEELKPYLDPDDCQVNRHEVW
ncbi:dolichyl-diphosphooligosaccharide--protein glycosyltransferase subunit 2 [Pseudoalteromonas sp. NZS100_1]|uniref:dolichyl-diphosphooligosaccharide--protein glycosyltransferase subunit 2 n=1 Tax=Pseudoalteromonas sp. NZS100_1 TaxID=2792073 RepID=UPI001E4DCD2F|nr:dolichyl-diphosphooligosaccharide--protein glycosyltransferase subunit 2 [Pseudoalteromonas sp. NZS100_1]